MEHDGMTDAELERRIAVIDWTLREDSPESENAFLASPQCVARGPEHILRLRRMFDDIRDWKLGRLAACTAELARRRDAAEAASREKASGGLYFGPWRGFSPLA